MCKTTAKARFTRSLWILLFFASSSNAGFAMDEEDNHAAGRSLPSIKPIKAKVSKRWWFYLPGSAELGGGYLYGEGVVEDSGAMLSLDISARPEFRYKKRKIRLGLPLDYYDRETIGFSFPVRHIQGGPEAVFRPRKNLELGLSQNTGWFGKSGWPDPYQPELDPTGNPTGRLFATDRYSYFHIEAAGYAEWNINKTLELELYTSFYRQNNLDDPSYDQIDEPTHLVPGDRDRVRAGTTLTGRALQRRWRYSVDLRADWINYKNTYARDAQTGLTHAPQGGETANPLQRFLELRLRQRNSLKLVPGRLGLVVTPEYTHNFDLFEGYYTYDQWQGNVDLSFSLETSINLDIGYSIEYRRYTRNGYRETQAHPALDNNTGIRMRIKHRVRCRAEYALFFSQLRLFIEGSSTWNRTNFPDLEPYIFPENSPYRIDWDYANAEILGGIAFDF